MPSKTIRPERTKQSQELVQRLLAERFGGSQTAMAEATGIPQAQISAIVTGKAGTGPTALRKLGKFDPTGVAKILGLTVIGAEEAYGPVAKRAKAALIAEGYPEEVADLAVYSVYRLTELGDDDFDVVLGSARAIAASLRSVQWVASQRRPDGRSDRPKKRKSKQ
jgi:hypothetical protein